MLTARLAAALAAVVAAVSLAWSWQEAAALRAEIRSRPQAGLALVNAALQAQQAELAAQVQRLADDRGFAAYVAAALARSPVDAFSLRDLLDERVDADQVPGVMLLDSAGRQVLSVGLLQAAADRGDDLPGVAAVLASGAAAVGFWTVAGGPASVALSPVRQGPLLHGVLVFARPVSPVDLATIARQSGVDLALEILDGGTRLGSPGASPADAPAGQDGLQRMALPDLEGEARVEAYLPVAERRARMARQRTAQILGGVAATLMALALWFAWRHRRAAASARRPTRREDAGGGDASALLIAWLDGTAPPAAPPASDLAACSTALPERFQALARLPSAPGVERLRALDRQEGGLVDLLVFLRGQARRTALAFRLGAEMKRAAQVHHPALQRVVHVGQHQAHLLIAIEELAGRSLADLLARNGPPPAAVGLLLARRVVAALSALHAGRVVPWTLHAGQVRIQPGGQIRLSPVDPDAPFGDRDGATADAGPADARARLIGDLSALIEALFDRPPADIGALLARCRGGGAVALEEIASALANARP